MKTPRLLAIALFACCALPAKDLKFPAPQTAGGMPLMTALARRATARAFDPRDLSSQQISDLLWAAWGVNRPDGKRTAPSAHNNREIDVYVLMKTGVFVYEAEGHSLGRISPEDRRALGGTQKFVKDAPVTLVLVADLAKVGGAGDPGRENVAFADSTPKGDATSKLFDRKKVDKLAKRKTEIEVACGVPQPEMADAIKAMNSVFLAPDEPLSGVVPDFWKRWLEPKSAPKKELGIVEPTANGALADGASGAMQQNVSTPRHQETPLPENHAGTFRVGGGVKAPRVIYAPDPAYSEIARQARYEATSVLWLVVDADGLPRNITIVRPSGLGLDEEAVRAVSSWKFDPATKEGRPVSVQINVEVSFRLY